MVIKGMDNSFGSISAFPAAGAREAKPTQLASSGGQFIGELVNKVNEFQQQSDAAVQKLVTGESRGLHEVMMAMEKSSISFQFMTQVRNKALEAYQEVMRMQV
jgi:flagellar hook-basal body complex protein FliE